MINNIHIVGDISTSGAERIACLAITRAHSYTWQDSNCTQSKAVMCQYGQFVEYYLPYISSI